MAAGRGTPLLTRRSPRAAGRGCGARCGVRDPERCGPSRCCSLRGLGLGGGASLLGWERPAGQGGSEPAQSPPRPRTAGGGPASPGRFHLRAGPRPGAPAATKATGPRPSCSPQPVGGGGAARSGPDAKEEERAGRGTVATPAVLGLWRPAAQELNPVQTFPAELRSVAPPLS